MTLNCPLQHFSAAEDERKRQKEQKGGWVGDGTEAQRESREIALCMGTHINMDKCTQTLQFCVTDF